MARLRREYVAGNGSSDDSDFVQSQSKQRENAAGGDDFHPVQRRTSPRKKVVVSYHAAAEPGDPDADSQEIMRPKTMPYSGQTARQIRLAPLSKRGISRPLQCPSLLVGDLDMKSRKASEISPRKQRLWELPYSEKPSKIPSTSEPSESAAEVGFEESIWCDSDATSDGSEDELPSPRDILKATSKSQSKPKSFKQVSETNAVTLGHRIQGPPFHTDHNPNGGPCDVKSKSSVNNVSRPGSSSDKENFGAFLRFSPPRIRSPSKAPEIERPVTPPQSPCKSRLQSPSKTKKRIPTPPLRQSLDAFWNADTVNDWNEQYSPRKILKSPRKLKFLQDGSSQSPTSSPRETQSPTKRSKAELEAKKNFEARKHKVAEQFLQELDEAVTQGRISALSASTGGVRFIWSRSLNSTAGRANWRKETTKIRQLDGATEATHKHHASIELAEKVIDDENRLLNVIAHEFCHLANFMVSGIKDQPHGKQFKLWGEKCTQAFGDRGVHVTTKHSYQIEYKYVWQCSNEDCGVEFKRHSKSIHPKKQTCGSCRSKLVQIKPLPRKDAGNGSNGYAAYMKANFATIKRGLPGASQKEIMEAVARKYRAEKEAKQVTLQNGSATSLQLAGTTMQDYVDNIGTALEVITLDD